MGVSALLLLLQEVVDNMSLAGCSNLNAWVGALDKRVEGVLAARLEKVSYGDSPCTRRHLAWWYTTIYCLFA